MNLKKSFFILPIIVVLLGTTLLLGTRPYYNWDMFPYMALAIENSDTPFDSTHAEVFREATLQLPKHDWLALYNLHPDLASDPSAFQAILKYFEIKPLYILTVKALHFVGFNLVVATYVPSMISYFLITLLLFWWLQKLLPLSFAALATLVIAVLPFLMDTARYSAPDMMCTLFIIAGALVVAEFSIIPGLIITSLSIFIRPDAVLFFLVLMFSLYKSQKVKLIPALIISLTMISITISITGTGILKEFLFTSIDYSSDWTMPEWIRHYLQGLWLGKNSMIHSYVPFFSLIALLTIYLRRANPASSDHFRSGLIFGMLAIFFIRFLLHPAVEDRMLIPCYLIIIVGFCKSVKDFKATIP